MTIEKHYIMRCETESCESCEYVLTDSKKRTEEIMLQHKWTSKEGKHFCPNCSRSHGSGKVGE
jgi:hypothetical protein